MKTNDLIFVISLSAASIIMATIIVRFALHFARNVKFRKERAKINSDLDDAVAEAERTIVPGPAKSAENEKILETLTDQLRCFFLRASNGGDTDFASDILHLRELILTRLRARAAGFGFFMEKDQQ